MAYRSRREWVRSPVLHKAVAPHPLTAMCPTSCWHNQSFSLPRQLFRPTSCRPRVRETLVSQTNASSRKLARPLDGEQCILRSRPFPMPKASDPEGASKLPAKRPTPRRILETPDPHRAKPHILETTCVQWRFRYRSKLGVSACRAV